jgi:phage/plasmid-like protein (TIGR03299 family)
MTVDVNEAFAAERSDQIARETNRAADMQARIADGRLVPLGEGRYRVNEPGTFDHGEVWAMRGGVAIPQHGLDTTTGEAALYTRVPAWHGLGSVVPAGVTDIDEVLRLGRIGFEVKWSPVYFRTSADGPDLVMPEKFVTYRDDTGAGLGAVGAAYTVLQNREVFEFLQELVGEFDVTWESAGALRGGRKVFVSMRLPDTVRIDAAGVNDEIVPFVVAVNSHDGSSAAQVVVTPWRPVCGNTERFAVRDAHTRWAVRHTRNALDRVHEARQTLRLSQAYFEAFAAEEEALARTDVAVADWRRLCEELWPQPEADASRRAKTIHGKRAEQLDALFAANTRRLGSTAYAAERAVTEFCDWKSQLRLTGDLRGHNLAARATAALEGTQDELKTRAHRRLLTLVRR